MRRLFLSTAPVFLLAGLLSCFSADALGSPTWWAGHRAGVAVQAGAGPAGAAVITPWSEEMIAVDASANPVILGAVGANAAITHGYEGRHSGWVTLEPGARPAYVGIHGGTAPVSLLRSPEGALFAYTGNTGNDFMHILRGKGAEGANGREIPAGDILGPSSASGPPSAPAEEQSPKPAPDAAASGPLQPFGLNNPENVVLVVRAAPPAEEQPVPKTAAPRRKPKPLKLGSYMSILSRNGGI